MSPVFNWLLGEIEAHALYQLSTTAKNVPQSVGAFLEREQLFGCVAATQRLRSLVQTWVDTLKHEVSEMQK